tara:strand:+ start:3850 stop:4044 length:195 start_codon:yes stop_codon:yes gene_type:complete
MLIIKVRKGNIEQAIKQMRRKFVKTQTMKNLRTNRYFKKPSDKRREEIQKAIRQEKWDRDNSDY